MGKLKALIPARLHLPEENLPFDVLLAFAPALFGRRCPSLAAVAAALNDAESLYLNTRRQN